MTSSPAMTWQEELASLVSDNGIRCPAAAGSDPPPPPAYEFEEASRSEESLKEQVKGFLKATGEMAVEFGRGVRDILLQSLEGAEDLYLVKRVKGTVKGLGGRLEFLNEYLPEDRDPVQSWTVVVSVMLVAILVGWGQEKRRNFQECLFRQRYSSVPLMQVLVRIVATAYEPHNSGVLSVNSRQQTSVELPKKLYIHPPSASRIQLPDGRHVAYQEKGVSSERARFSLIAPHSFLSSRLAGIPGIKDSLLEEFGIRLVTYDLPGFGESDPHPDRNLNSSAIDMLHLANAVGVMDKFWVVGYSGGGKHAWAAVRYIPGRLAGVAMFAPMGNPYDYSMTKEERYRTWEKWTAKRKMMYILARRFPSLLPYFYRRSFLSGIQGRLEKWLSLSLGKKDKALMEDQVFKEFWERDVEESVRQRNSRPFVEEVVLQVSDWGFNLGDLQVQKKHEGRGLLLWLKSIFTQSEKEWAGFLGPIHIWQGMDDRVVPSSMTEFVRRVVPGATVHRLLDEGHFSYFCFCDECHRQVFSTLFGIPQGPLTQTLEEEDPPSPVLSEEYFEETSLQETEQNCTLEE